MGKEGGLGYLQRYNLQLCVEWYKVGVGHNIISRIKDGNKVNAQPKTAANNVQFAVIKKHSIRM